MMTICFTRSSNNILYLKKFFIKFKECPELSLAIKALHRELDTEDLASITPEDIEVWALEIAAENSEE